jgi:hypothetical protein
MAAQVTRQEFLKNQSEIKAPDFMPSNGICHRCKKDIIPALIEKGNDGTQLVTGCPLCHRSYCD